ncbi:MAG: hypothetical protein N838_08840 [Thiohalocapsa sp. PB-PSB1]|nr:MAG: hypothetical protein N838_08840 [Thiohalocapsa sp. PB-PSB1]
MQPNALAGPVCASSWNDTVQCGANEPEARVAPSDACSGQLLDNPW